MGNEEQEKVQRIGKLMLTSTFVVLIFMRFSCLRGKFPEWSTETEEVWDSYGTYSSNWNFLEIKTCFDLLNSLKFDANCTSRKENSLGNSKSLGPWTKWPWVFKRSFQLCNFAEKIELKINWKWNEKIPFYFSLGNFCEIFGLKKPDSFRSKFEGYGGDINHVIPAEHIGLSCWEFPNLSNCLLACQILCPKVLWIFPEVSG